MLQSLSVENYALIEKLDIDFKQGFNIITGETGAGKSILLGALGLILGQRADTSSLKDSERNCVIEGIFNVEKMNLRPFFEANDIDYDHQTVVRRVITPSGKTRAYINDIPVNLNTLRDLGLQLIDIHSQHETLLLSNQQFQLNVVDLMAGNAALLADYQHTYTTYKQEQKILNELKENQQKQAADLDYLLFQLKQLEEATLSAGEQEQLEEEERELSNAEAIKTELQYCGEALEGDEGSVLLTLKSCHQSLKRIKEVLGRSESLMERIDSVTIELKDISREIEGLNEKIEINPERLAYVKERLDLIYTLQQKHRASSIDELIVIQQELSHKVQHITSYDEQIAKQATIVEQLHEQTLKHAKQLTQQRKAATTPVEEYVSMQLAELGMPYAKLRIDLTEVELSGAGADKIAFLFSGNKQLAFQEVSKVASGGEMSRLMLSIKTLLAKKGDLPTIIFDEIDTGVSGEVADKMGSIIKEVAQNIQVINITHLPQIASKGDYHFFVYKENDDTSTSTRIRLLTKEERITEIAKMLSGQNLTPAAIQNAKALLKS